MARLSTTPLDGRLGMRDWIAGGSARLYHWIACLWASLASAVHHCVVYLGRLVALAGFSSYAFSMSPLRRALQFGARLWSLRTSALRTTVMRPQPSNQSLQLIAEGSDALTKFMKTSSLQSRLAPASAS
jgi:hypothetical protein